ncbi:helix-turn-helix domain-containing protein [uncultured Polaribacter sp.]|uniref:helix-turn-helix domain-containing protein n=1 Tax=uncultured Polaribacter sp. TaxID=174711 RepID=UPI00259BDB56|nr:helix-turn-helix domain-containing protein [uncultured Polaribacter sp.]
MEAIILSSQQYTDLVNRLDLLGEKLEKKQKSPKDIFLDNQEFIQLMNISKRTAQTWRDSGIISYSQIGSKIYYRLSDVQKLLDKNYKEANSNKNSNQ